MQRTLEEEQNISKTKDRIENLFVKINADAKQCILFGMANGMVRIIDNARVLKEQNAITSNEHLDIIDKIDNIITDVSRRCKCEKIWPIKIMTSNDYLDIIDRIDNIIIETSRKCKCKKIWSIKIMTNINLLTDVINKQ